MPCVLSTSPIDQFLHSSFWRILFVFLSETQSPIYFQNKSMQTVPIMKWGLSQTPPFPLESFVGVGGGEECCPAGLSLV